MRSSLLHRRHDTVVVRRGSTRSHGRKCWPHTEEHCPPLLRFHRAHDRTLCGHRPPPPHHPHRSNSSSFVPSFVPLICHSTASGSACRSFVPSAPPPLLVRPRNPSGPPIPRRPPGLDLDPGPDYHHLRRTDDRRGNRRGRDRTAPRRRWAHRGAEECAPARARARCRRRFRGSTDPATARSPSFPPRRCHRRRRYRRCGYCHRRFYSSRCKHPHPHHRGCCPCPSPPRLGFGCRRWRKPPPPPAAKTHRRRPPWRRRGSVPLIWLVPNGSLPKLARCRPCNCD
mmetsp:Transcript_25925/g.74958  ORF Transcript_25925/g.74958 Transcript_25925/m.74958 type:complete len:284 (-) Transcript_25925:76-927(-)